ncbi:MAG: septation protein A [Gammaproteobacteria bacterium]|nr:MAG: septation protein A [Gammaproteobacteria bacterium]
MHPIFEYLPLVVFFVFYKVFDLYWATGALIVLSGLQIIYFLLKKKPVPKRHLIIFALILVFGGLTIFLHDDTFLKWKVTILNTFFAVTLIFSRYVLNNNIIKNFLKESMELPEKIWDRLNISWALFFLLCGVLNWYIAFNFSQETWVNFKVFGLTGLTFVFAIGSILALYRFLPLDDEVEKTKTTKVNKP